MNKEKLLNLLRQYFNDTISPSDYDELLEYLKTADPDFIEKLIDEEMLDLESGKVFSKSQSDKVLNSIKNDSRFVAHTQLQHKEEYPKIIKLHQRTWFKIAAAVLIFAIAAIWVSRYNKNVKPDEVAISHQPVKILPGSQQATLTMSNGKVIVLTNAANGVLANVGGSKIVKQVQGRIIYDSKAGSTANNEVSYNTLTTPRGGEYQVVLPDGTKVWLNAASSITYPVRFTGNERRVKLIGEAYFEVAKNKEKPFYVAMGDAQVRVLGTHFNISAYNDDNAITTTLLEGSVQVSKNNSAALIKPGQQAVVTHSSNEIAVSEANIEDAMAWKNGLFIFNGDNITGIMKKVSRWYDVDVNYETELNDQQFGGSYHRSKGINELLQYLEMIGKVHFRIQGRRITVMK